MTAVEKAKALVDERQKEVNEKYARLRQLQTQADRLASRLKEVKLAGDNGDAQAKTESRELTRSSLELELEVANAKFSYEDAMERLEAANKELANAVRAAQMEELEALGKERLGVVEAINNNIDALEAHLAVYKGIVEKQLELAGRLGISKSKIETENGPVVRLARLLEGQGRRVESSEERNEAVRLPQPAAANRKESRTAIVRLRQPFIRIAQSMTRRVKLPSPATPASKEIRNVFAKR